MKELTVYDFLGITKEEMDKKADGEHCVKCGKPTRMAHNLCHGHHIAYHRWRNKMKAKLYDLSDIKIDITKGEGGLPLIEKMPEGEEKR